MPFRSIAGLSVLFSAHAWATPFSFVAYGDTSYTLPRDHGRNQRLVEAINREAPAFAIHVGDFKGYTSCGDAAYRTQFERFTSHRHPVVLTPGDNDWTDCWEDGPGRFDPLERLTALRRLFFAQPRSLGGTTMPVQRQSAQFPENAAWTRDSVEFATVHIVGPHNNLVVRERKLANEAIDRTLAGQQWMREAFARARASSARGLVIAFQLDPFLPTAPNYADGPTEWVRRIIGEEAARFDGQVLIVHGDSHRFVVDQPFRRADIDRGSTVGMNITRLQVPGWPDHRAIRIDVNPDRPGMFSFAPLLASEEASGAAP